MKASERNRTIKTLRKAAERMKATRVQFDQHVAAHNRMCNAYRSLPENQKIGSDVPCYQAILEMCRRFDREQRAVERLAAKLKGGK